MLRALHLFANHKVTGPAELALETARAVASTGRVAATFYSSDVSKTRHRDRWLAILARERGVPEPADLLGTHLPKHISFFSALGDVRRIARHLETAAPDLVHCHLPNDHLLAAWAVARARRPVPIVRTLYDGETPRSSWRARRTLGRTAAVICLSPTVASELAASAATFGLDPGRIRALEPPIDTGRFDPARDRGPERTREAKRAVFGFVPGDVVVGIVARMQTHRRFEVLLEAVKRAREKAPALKLLVVGRGTNQETVAREPARALGPGAVVFSGYQSGEDYVATLAAMDAKVFLVPGSDGSCRAVREALSMGLPVVAARRGMLPELVRDGATGVVLEDEPAPLSDAFVALARDSARRATLGAEARRDAVRRFSFAGFGASVAAVYDSVLAPARTP